jgi:hypothetical protein
MKWRQPNTMTYQQPWPPLQASRPNERIYPGITKGRVVITSTGRSEQSLIGQRTLGEGSLGISL